MKHFKLKVGAALAAVVAPGMALAETTYVDDITAAADWTTVIAGIGTVAAAVAGLYVVIRGGRTLLGFIRR